MDYDVKLSPLEWWRIVKFIGITNAQEAIDQEEMGNAMATSKKPTNIDDSLEDLHPLLVNGFRYRTNADPTFWRGSAGIVPADTTGVLLDAEMDDDGDVLWMPSTGGLPMYVAASCLIGPLAVR